MFNLELDDGKSKGDVRPLQNATVQRQLNCIRGMWLLIGFSNAFPSLGLAFYMIRVLKAPPSIQAIIGVLSSFAWNLKVVVAFISDSVPIFGYRRVPYLYIGLIAYSIAFLTISLFPPSISVTATALFLSSLGAMTSGVMCDTLVVENMRMAERTAAEKGTLQTHCWILLTIGSVMGTVVGTAVAKSNITYSGLFLVAALLRLLVMPLVWMLKDPKVGEYSVLVESKEDNKNTTEEEENGVLVGERAEGRGSNACGASDSEIVASEDEEAGAGPGGPSDDKSGDSHASYGATSSPRNTESNVGATSRAKAQLKEIWEALQENRVWQPGLFIFLFSIFPSAGAVLPSYYVIELKFNEAELALIMIVGGLSGALGMWVYNRYLKGYHWHWFFFSVIIIASAISLTQLILIFRVNRKAGIPDLAFAIGDDIIVDIAKTLLNMPLLILVASICPEGVESSVYAAITSIQIAGGTISGSISAMIIEGFGITLSDYSNLWMLVMTCALVRLLAIPFIPLLPTKVLVARNINTSWWGGLGLVVMLVTGICWAIGLVCYKLSITK